MAKNKNKKNAQSAQDQNTKGVTSMNNMDATAKGQNKKGGSSKGSEGSFTNQND